jgi:hypothetical protein
MIHNGILTSASKDQRAAQTLLALAFRCHLCALIINLKETSRTGTEGITLLLFVRETAALREEERGLDLLHSYIPVLIIIVD